MKRLFRYAMLAVLPAIVLWPAAAQKKDAKKNAAEEGITREQADQILNELRQIRQLLEQQPARNGAPAPARAKLDLAGLQMLGSATAPITLVEFTDYQCPYCRQFQVAVFGDLKKNFIDTGKVRFYSRDLPIDSLHPNAMRAAEAARCASDQGQYWTMREIMGSNPDKLDMENLVAAATGLHMNAQTFRTCLDTRKYKEAVQTDVLEAMKIGAQATPTFLLGKSTPEGVEGELIEGTMPFADFEKAIAKLAPAQ